MGNIEIGSTIMLVDRTGLGALHDERWRVVGVEDDIYSIMMIRKDGGLNKRRGVRKISRKEIAYAIPPKPEDAPVPEPTKPEPEPVKESPKEENKPTGRRNKMPSWKKNVPTALEPFIDEKVSLVELIETAQSLILKGEHPEQAAELKNYIKVNRRFIRKREFEW